jgi:peptide/nickel transport system permease protein
MKRASGRPGRSLAGLLRNRKAVVGMVLLGLFVAMALVGPLFVGDPTAFVARPHQPPSGAHWLGTSGQGQDIFAQTIAGARLTLAVGFAVGAAVTLIAIGLGLTAAYFGGWVDDLLSLVTNVFLVLPGLPLAVVLAAYLPPGPATIGLVLIVTGWAWNARVLRAQALAVRQKEFIQASLVTGEHPLRIVFVEMLPNLLPIVASCFIGATIYAIGAQVGLEFLGLGDPGRVSWGTNLYWASNDAALLTGSWWLFVPTGVCVALVGFSLVMINFAVDEIADPRLASGGRTGPGFCSATVVRRVPNA